MLYAALVCTLSGLSFFAQDANYTVSDEDTPIARRCVASLEGRGYLDPDVELQALARKLGVPPNTLSGEINRDTGAKGL